MNIDVVLALMSITLVAPAMVALVYLVVTGRFSATEDARSLPLREREDDFWQCENPRAARAAREKAR